MEWRRSPAGLQRTSLSTPFFMRNSMMCSGIRYRKSFAQILIVRSEKLSFSVSLEWETEMSNISLTVPFFFFTPERERKSWTPTRESACLSYGGQLLIPEMISGIFAV